MDYKKKVSINDKIKLIRENNILNKIFELCLPELIINGKHKYTQNNNGIYFNMKYLSDNILIQLEEIIDNYLKDHLSESDNFSLEVRR